MSPRPQIDALRRGVDIVVATPGRLLDHANERNIDLRSVRYLVLDEADRMLDMGFIRDIRRVLAMLPPKRQNMLFSATFSRRHPRARERPAAQSAHDRSRAAQCAGRTRRAPRAPGVAGREARGAEPPAARVGAHAADAGLHAHQARREPAGGAVDAATASQCAAIHGNKSQGARTRALEDFKEYKVQVLVATDIAARGLDITELPQVVNYELPHVPEDYVHRIGRTGRAGWPGQALSLVSDDERDRLRAIETRARPQDQRAAARSHADSASLG